MFYIIQFFKIIKENFLKGISFFLVSASFILVVGNWTVLKDRILDLYPDYMKGPSFYALISSGQDYLNIQRKLISLPGISSVKILEKETLKNQTEKIMKNFQLANEDVGIFDFIGLEVMFDKNINDRGQELIKNYLTKLAGDNNITMGKTTIPPEKDNIKSIMDFINQGGWWAVSLIFSFLWIFSLLIFKKEVKKSSYLIEQFQRKSLVELKILFSGLLIIYFFSAGIIFFSPSPEWISVILIGFFYLVGLVISGGKKAWES